MADVAPTLQMIRWRRMTIAADIFRRRLILGMTCAASHLQVGSHQGYRVQLWWQGSAFEAGWGVAFLAIRSEVSCTGWLVAIGALVDRFLATSVASCTIYAGVSAF